MKYVGLYHLNVYTYGDPKWFPDMDPKLRDVFNRVTKGMLSGKAGEKPKEDFKLNGEHVNTPEKGVAGIPFVDEDIGKAALEYLDRVGKSSTPFFMSVNFMKVHQPNLPHRQLQGSIQPSRRQWSAHRGDRRGQQPGVEGVEQVRRRGSSSIRPLAGPPGKEVSR